MTTGPGSVPCLNSHRDTLRTDDLRDARNAPGFPPDIAKAMFGEPGRPLFGARKTGWPPPIPVTTGPA